MIWDLEKVEKINFTKLEQEVMNLMSKYGDGNKELEADLFLLHSSIEKERQKKDAIKSLAFDLANKI